MMTVVDQHKPWLMPSSMLAATIQPQDGATMSKTGTGSPNSPPATSTPLRPIRSERCPAPRLVSALTTPKLTMKESPAVAEASPNSRAPRSGTTSRSSPTMAPTNALMSTSRRNWPRLARRPSIGDDAVGWARSWPDGSRAPAGAGVARGGLIASLNPSPDPRVSSSIHLPRALPALLARRSVRPVSNWGCRSWRDHQRIAVPHQSLDPCEQLLLLFGNPCAQAGSRNRKAPGGTFCSKRCVTLHVAPQVRQLGDCTGRSDQQRTHSSRGWRPQPEDQRGSCDVGDGIPRRRLGPVNDDRPVCAHQDIVGMVVAMAQTSAVRKVI